MLKYLLRVFGSGRLPQQARHLVAAEESRLSVEAMVGSISHRSLRGSGGNSRGRRRWFLGSLAISAKRVLVYRYGSCLLNVPLSDKRIGAIDFSAETPGVLTIAYDASLFQAGSSDEVQICLHTPEALRVCETMAANVRKSRIRVSDRTPLR
jgi:hypothetical protein